MINIIDELEKGLEMSYLDRMKFVWKTYHVRNKILHLINREAEKLIKFLKPGK